MSRDKLRTQVIVAAAAIALFALSALAAGCGAIPGLVRPTSTATPTSTPTPTPTPTSTPTPTPTATPIPLTLSLRLDPASVLQGQIATLVIEASRPADLSATLQGKPLPLFSENGRWYGLVGIWAGTQPAAWPIAITALDPLGGTPVVEQRELRITARQFEIEALELDQSTLDLILDQDAVQKEAQLVASLIAPRTEKRLWQGLFRQPVEGEVTSTYGLRRSYNGGPAGEYHGGLDLATDEGVPVSAANAGQVVFAGPLKVRGNVVIIDHGWGLYSGYYHMSALAVEQGQSVRQGDTIGRVGSTGLSTGPHVHWCIWLGGSTVDPAFLLGWQLPD